MDRRWRMKYPGALYHVLYRGMVVRMFFFQTMTGICFLFLSLLEELSERFNIEVYAYVLMSNQ